MTHSAVPQLCDDMLALCEGHSRADSVGAALYLIGAVLDSIQDKQATAPAATAAYELLLELEELMFIPDGTRPN